MSHSSRVFLAKSSILPIALFLTPLAGFAQSGQAAAAKDSSAQEASSPRQDRWLHVRVDNTNSKGETVRVNVPLELAESVLPAINRDRLHNGKIRITRADCDGVDLRALLDAVRSAKDGEFVTVLNNESDVRVAKQDGHFLIHVLDKHKPNKSQVEVKIPMKVVEAMFSAGKDELDLVAGLHALSFQGDTELVSVKSEDSTVRIWLDSKNVTN